MSTADTFRPADPYLAWTELTGYSGHAAAARSNAPIPLLIKLKDDKPTHLRELAHIAAAWDGYEGRFVTATAQRDRLGEIQKSVEAMEFALPIEAKPISTEASPPTEQRNDVVLAVIDRGCAFLNAAFCKDAPEQARNRAHVRKTRLIALWDQGPGDQGRPAAVSSPWRSLPDFGYGRELDSNAINTQLARLAAPDHLTEAKVYKELKYLIDGAGLLRDSAHGTHVLDTAGGQVDANPPRSSAKPSVRDAASHAPLIFVDLPGLASDDTTGGAFGAFLLDALQYIRRRAGKGIEVIVNISVGAFAGPHDGSSIVEQAIEEFVNKDGHMLVIVAGGNAALERWHAHGELQGQGTAELRWRTMPEDPTDSFLEVWFAAADPKSTAKVEIQVTPPNGPRTDWLSAAQNQHAIRDHSENLIGALFGRARQGERDGMFLVAIGPNAGKRRMAPPGLWRIELRNATPAIPARFDAWIQRDEPVFDPGAAPVQSYFEWASPGVTVGGAAGGLSNLATGKSTIVVAASDLYGNLTRYSSRGGRPRRDDHVRREVDAAAPADESPTAIGLLAAGVRSFTLMRMGGTSVAAPAAARRIYNELARSQPASPKGPPGGGLVTQVREMLAKVEDHPSDEYGEVDIPLLKPDRDGRRVAQPIYVPAVIGEKPNTALPSSSASAVLRAIVWARRIVAAIRTAVRRRRAPTRLRDRFA